MRNHLHEADRSISSAIERVHDSNQIPKGLKIILEDELRQARKHVANGRVKQEQPQLAKQKIPAGGDD